MSRKGKCMAIFTILALLLAMLINPAWAGRGNGDDGGNGNKRDDNAPVSLTREEIAGLQFMREEEKLAGDVYLNLFDAWVLTVFENIARS